MWPVPINIWPRLPLIAPKKFCRAPHHMLFLPAGFQMLFRFEMLTGLVLENGFKI